MIVRRARLEALHAAAAALAAIAVHGRTLAFGLTGLDDRDLLVDDAAFLADASNLWRAFSPGRAYMHVVEAGHAYWRPLVTASYVLDAQWGGARPLAYHATNVLLWAAASVLVGALLRRLGLGVRVALLASLVFAVHPALAPAVAWIPGRNDALWTVMALAAWLALRRRRWAAHLVFFGLALLAKETAMAMPAVWLAADVASRARARPRAWLWASWAAMVGARLALQPASVRAAGGLLANLRLVPVALGKIVLPVAPTAVAALDDLAAWPGVVAGAAFVAAIAVLRGRASARVRLEVVGVGAAAFLAPLVPPMLVPGTLELDARLAMPAVGVLVASGELARAWRRPATRAASSAIAAFAAVGVLALALVTAGYESAFRDPLAFGREAVAGSPRSPLAHVCLGQALQRAGDDDRAVAEYRAALALGPAQVAHNDIAVAAMKRARWGEAEDELRAELDVNPGYGTAYYNLAIVLRREGRLPEACEAAERAAAQRTDDAAWRAERDRDCAAR
jgi:tetratricopeptide (TPR) repeat protein